MKKILCIILSLTFIFLLCGCGAKDTESKFFSQKVTIVKMPSPTKCKTSNSIAVVDEVIDVLGLIEKSPINETVGKSNINGWEIMIKLKIDGQELNYTIGGVFTDADGSQYYTENLDEIKEKINEIYDKIDAPEVDYP